MNAGTAPAGLTDLSKYIYGATRLGHDGLAQSARVDMALRAMAAGIWFHVSHEYGNALEVLRTAFDADRARVPKMIFKIGFRTVAEVRETVLRDLDALAIEAMDIGQLCLVDGLAEDFSNGGASVDAILQLREEGLVRRFVLEVFPWSSAAALAAIDNGVADRTVDGFIFYLNPLQRFALNPLWHRLRQRGDAIVAMRTVAGNHVHALRDVPGAAWKEYLQQRAVDVAPVFDRAGVPDWSEFCVRFAHSFPEVRATVGSTARSDNFERFVEVANAPIEPLARETLAALEQLAEQWSDAFDRHAAPGSM